MTVGPDQVFRHLPSIERARAEGLSLKARVWYGLGSSVDLLAIEPREQVRLAAVTLDARVLSRSTWEKDVEMSEELFADFPSATPPAYGAASVGTYRSLVATLDRGPGRCTMCPAESGRNPCGGCGGTGVIVVGSQNDRVACPRCGGARAVVCSTCDGTGTTRRARVRYVDDREGSLRYTYVPTMTAALELAVDESLSPATHLPSCLRFEPRAQQAGGPYRSTSVEPSFHGYRFGDALRRALIALGGIAGGDQVLREDVRTFARPILWLRYSIAGSRREAALVTRPDGALAGIVAP